MPYLSPSTGLPQPVVTLELSEGGFHPVILIINNYIKQYLSWYWHLRNTAKKHLLAGIQAADHYTGTFYVIFTFYFLFVQPQTPGLYKKHEFYNLYRSNDKFSVVMDPITRHLRLLRFWQASSQILHKNLCVQHYVWADEKRKPMKWHQETVFSFPEKCDEFIIKIGNVHIIIPKFIRMDPKVFAIFSICSNAKIILTIFTMM